MFCHFVSLKENSSKLWKDNDYNYYYNLIIFTIIQKQFKIHTLKLY